MSSKTPSNTKKTISGRKRTFHDTKDDTAQQEIMTPSPPSTRRRYTRSKSIQHNDGDYDDDSYNRGATPQPTPSFTKVTATPPSSTKSNKAEKAYKGLRHFSLMVCKKVEMKGTTTYNEVADELVIDIMADRLSSEPADGDDSDNKSERKQQLFKVTSSTPRSSSNPKTKQQFDEKNIRRRVYDALNVLMAMDIITKDKKEITWRGLPTTPTTTAATTVLSPEEDYETMKRKYESFSSVVEKKREQLYELLIQQICFRNLAELNYKREDTKDNTTLSSSSSKNDVVSEGGSNNNKTPKGSMAATTATAKGGSSASSSVRRKLDDNFNVDNSKTERKESTKTATKDNKIPLPFIVVNTHSSAVIQCNMSRDLTDVMFDFSMPFEINDDNTILKKLGLHHTNEKVLHEMLPDDLYSYCQKFDLFREVLPIVPKSASAAKAPSRPSNEPRVSLSSSNDYFYNDPEYSKNSKYEFNTTTVPLSPRHRQSYGHRHHQ